MSAINTEVCYYLKIAIEINKNVGGTRGYEAQTNSKDQFSVTRDKIYQNFHFIKKKLQERQNKRGVEVVRINQEIKQKMGQTMRQIDRMRQSLTDQDSNEASKQLKLQIIDRLKDQANNLQKLIDQVQQSSRGLMGNKKHNGMTLTDMRAQLLDDDKGNNNTYRIQSKKKQHIDPTDIQMQAMENWKKTDQQIDDHLDVIIDKVGKWKIGVLQTGKLIDQTDVKIQQLTKQVDKVNDDLLKSNKQLKGIVEKYRKPHKFCIDVVLILILLGLLVAIIKLST